MHFMRLVWTILNDIFGDNFAKDTPNILLNGKVIWQAVKYYGRVV